MADKGKKKDNKGVSLPDSDETAGSSTSYFFFVIITTLFALVKYNVSDGYHAMATFCYIFAVIIGEFILSLNNKKTMWYRKLVDGFYIYSSTLGSHIWNNSHYVKYISRWISPFQIHLATVLHISRFKKTIKSNLST